MSADHATLAYYEKAAPHYTASTAQDRHRHLDPFLDRLGPAASVLELGCGAALVPGMTAAMALGRSGGGADVAAAAAAARGRRNDV